MGTRLIVATTLNKGDYHGNLHNYLDRVEHNWADNQLWARLEGLRGDGMGGVRGT